MRFTCAWRCLNAAADAAKAGPGHWARPRRGPSDRRSLGVARRYERRSASSRRSRATRPVSGLLVPVEVARRLLLEPQAVVLGRLLEEVRGLLQHVLLAGLRIFAARLERLLGGDLVGLVVEPRVLVVAGRRRGVGLRRQLGDARLAVGQLVLGGGGRCGGSGGAAGSGGSNSGTSNAGASAAGAGSGSGVRAPPRARPRAARTPPAGLPGPGPPSPGARRPPGRRRACA